MRASGGRLQLFLTTLAAYLQSFAMFAAAGIPARDFLERTAPGEDVAVFLPAAARAVDGRVYPGELANVVMMGAKSLYDRAIIRAGTGGRARSR